jgi:tetratricopeptide (TPR) repeat protein
VERPELKLVTDSPKPRRSPEAAMFGAAILVAAALATLAGADSGRRPFAAAPIAESALARTLAGRDPIPARDGESLLRARLRRIPLDAVSRTILASLMAETADTESERAAASDQATAAMRLAPTDEWIAHATARVLARCGRTELALSAIHSMFEYAPDDAAAALADVEPFVQDGRLEEGLEASPSAWRAWSDRLRAAGREAEADARVAAGLARWPGDLDLLRIAASVAASRDRLDELVRLVPPDRALPNSEQAAPLYAFRARSKAATGDPAGARADAVRAVELSRGDPWVLDLAGTAVSSSDPAAARDFWSRALFRLTATDGTRGEALWLRLRLARLDEREGRAGDALRSWRSILAEHPDNLEAKTRIAALTGEGPP